MNIVVVSQIFHPVPFRVNDIVQALTAAGHEVKVVTGLPDYGLPSIPKEYRWFRKRREEFFGARVIRVPTFARRSGMLHRALNYVSFVVSGWFYMSFTNKKEVDVIFCYETSPVLQAIPAIRLKKGPKRNWSFTAWIYGRSHSKPGRWRRRVGFTGAWPLSVVKSIGPVMRSPCPLPDL